MSHMPYTDSTILEMVLESYQDVFCAGKMPVGVARSLPPVVIDTDDAEPISQNPYRMPLTKRQQVEECVEKMLKDEIIWPSSSPWASTFTFVPKKDGSTCCVSINRS